MTPPLLLGIDGGGTSTTALVAHALSGQILGKGHAGPSNPKAAGWPAANQALAQAANQALAAAHLSPNLIISTCYGISGCDHPDESILFAQKISLPFPNPTVVNDGALVIAAGTPLGHGIAIIAGTGSIVVGRAPNGHVARAGGWGHIFGDEGSAYGTAVAALRALARTHDHRDPKSDPILENAIFESLNINNVPDLVSIIYNLSRSEIAAISQAVNLAAANHSPIASDILNQAAHELALAARAVAHSLHLDPNRPASIALAGGFLLNSAYLRDQLTNALPPPWQTQIASVDEPAQGAIILAQRRLQSNQ